MPTAGCRIYSIRYRMKISRSYEAYLILSTTAYRVGQVKRHHFIAYNNNLCASVAICYTIC